MPNDFIWILEESGLIEGVGAWVVHEACAQIAAWQCQGLSDPGGGQRLGEADWSGVREDW